MKSIINVIKMDMAMCRKSMVSMILSMLVAGIGSLFFLSPLFLGFFILGSTAVVSAIFSVEIKSKMGFFYGCFPIKKWEYIIGRSLTCLLIIAIPAVISIIFIQIEMKFSLCRIEDMRIIMELFNQYQILIICFMIMLALVAATNLLIASFLGKIELREILEVVLLLLEALLVSIIMFLVQRIFYNSHNQEFLTDLFRFVSEHRLLTCIMLIFIGLIVLTIGTIISLKNVCKRLI